jgi:hypothetical protein
LSLGVKHGVVSAYLCPEVLFPFVEMILGLVVAVICFSLFVDSNCTKFFKDLVHVNTYCVVFIVRGVTESEHSVSQILKNCPISVFLELFKPVPKSKGVVTRGAFIMSCYTNDCQFISNFSKMLFIEILKIDNVNLLKRIEPMSLFL